MRTTWKISSNDALNTTIDGETTKPLQFAREELERYLGRILNIKPTTGGARIVLSRGETESLGEEGYRYQVDGNDLRIIGGGDRGVVFGSYAFLREHCGCQFSGLGPDGEHVPTRDAIEASITNEVFKPNIYYRGLQFSSVENAEHYRRQIDWMAKNGLNYVMVMFAPDDHGLAPADIDPETGEPANAGDGNKYRITESWYDTHLAPELEKRGLITDCNHHNLRFWLPPDKYFDEHPEWYAMTDGERGKNFSQMCVCTSNDDAVDTLIENVGEFLRRRPTIRDLGVIVEDGNGMCQCDACRSQDVHPEDAFKPVGDHRSPDGENRSLMNRYGRLLNRVAEGLRGEFPELRLYGAAYVDIQWPPRDVKLDDAIGLWLAIYWRDGARPMIPGGTSQRNEMFIDLIRQWKDALRGPLILYEYYMGMNAQRSLPYPMSKVICDEWKHLRQLGVEGATVQMMPSCQEAYALNLLAFARSGWQEDVDHDALLDGYLLGMFGEAGAALRPYFQGMVDALEDMVREESTILQPDGENVRYFMSKVDARGPLEEARKLATTERECRQLDRFAQYVKYLELAAENDYGKVIDYLATVDAVGWFGRSARTRWISNFKRLKAAAQ